MWTICAGTDIFSCFVIGMFPSASSHPHNHFLRSRRHVRSCCCRVDRCKHRRFHWSFLRSALLSAPWYPTPVACFLRVIIRTTQDRSADCCRYCLHRHRIRYWHALGSITANDEQNALQVRCTLWTIAIRSWKLAIIAQKLTSQIFQELQNRYEDLAWVEPTLMSFVRIRRA